MKLVKKAGAVSEIWQVWIADSSSAVGAGLTGLVFNSAGLTAYFHRDVDTTATLITLVTMTVGTFTSSGFKEIDATNMPGWYQFCPPNAAIAAGAKSCAFLLKGATNMAQLAIEAQLTAADFDDAVRHGMTALPNAAAEAAGGLYTRGAGAGQINQPANGMVDINAVNWRGTALAAPATAGIPKVAIEAAGDFAQAAADKVWLTAARTLTAFGFSVALSAAAVQAIWDALTTALTTVGSIGKRLADNIDATISSRSSYAGGDTAGTTTLLSRLTAPRATNLDNLDAAISTRSTFAGGAVASVTANVNADVKKINGVTVNGTGAPGTPWGP